MHVGWLFGFFVGFMVAAAGFFSEYCRAHSKCGEKWRRKRNITRAAVIVCAVISITSLVSFLCTLAFGKEAGPREAVSSGAAEVIYLAGITVDGENKFLLEDNDMYQFLYFDDDNKIQVGRAKVEDSNENYGYLDGKACAIITTNHYRVWKSWLCFGFMDDIYTKTYDFYTY